MTAPSRTCSRAFRSTLHNCRSLHRHAPAVLSTPIFSTSPTRNGSTLAPSLGENSVIWRRGRTSVPFFTDNRTLNQNHVEQNSLFSQRNAFDQTQEPWPPSTIPLEAYKPVPSLTLGRTLKVYSQLSKSRLTILVVLTAMSGVALSPLPATIPILLSTAIGTSLCSAAANTFNQISEVPFDAQMTRTRTRPLVRKAISTLHAASFGIGAGLSGVGILWAGTGMVPAVLGAGTIVLYSWAYTALKRKHIVNTWVGAVVGAIPPLMGWAACGGALLPSSTSPISLYLPPFLTNTSIPADLSHYTSLISSTPLIDNPLAPFALFLFHYAWQFPHFNSLSHFTRSGYAQAGYHMLSVLDPSKNALVALRHSVLLTALSCTLIPLSGLTTWWFAVTSLVPNAVLLNWSWKFWRNGGEKMARGLWGSSLWYLPVMLGLMMYHKRGMEWMSWLGLKEVEANEETIKEE